MKKYRYSISASSSLARRTTRLATSRRRFLLGGTGLFALPALEIFHAEEARSQNGKPNLKLVVYFLPNGRLPTTWLPSATGTNFTMPQASKALEPFKSDLVFFSGLRNTAARLSMGAGDHARGCSGVAVCTPLQDFRRTDHAIISVDQLLVQKLNPQTRFKSLQYSAGEPWGADAGASGAYTQVYSWTGTQPLDAVADPLVAFNDLFGGGEGATAAEQLTRQQSMRSIFDYLEAETTGLSQTLGVEDRAKLEQYLQAVRELESQLTSTAGACVTGAPPAAAADYPGRVSAFHDLMALALQCDQTRFISFMIEYGLSSRPHPELGAPGGHHATSHYNSSEVQQQLIKLETWQGDQVGKFIQKVQATQDTDGSSLLDNTLVLVLPSMGHGNPHDHDDVSPVFVGKCGGAFQGGQYIKSDRPIADMYVTLMHAFGVKGQSFGADGREVIPGVLA